MWNGGLRCEGTERQDDVVGTVNKGMLELADDIGEDLRVGHILVQEYIKLSIMEPLASEVMMTWMRKVYRDKLVLGGKMFQERGPGKISRITIGITSYVDGAIMTGSNLINKDIQKGEC